LNARPLRPKPKRAKPATSKSPRYCSLALLSLLSACAADPEFGRDGTLTDLQAQATAEKALSGARFTFHHSDYYSLTRPNLSSCAGDARTFYDPIAMLIPGSDAVSYGYDAVAGITGLDAPAGAEGITGPLRLPADLGNGDQTIRPSFIKNVSIDMTDANAAVANNLAASCTLGTGPTVPATSNCASFDYGAVGGIASTLGGTMLVVGGVQGYNYGGILPAALQTSFPFQGMALGCGTITHLTSTLNGASATNACNSGIFALGVNTLPAAAFQSDPSLMPAFEGTSGPTGAVSMWGNLSGASDFAGPLGGAGASITYDPGLKQVVMFGGASPLAGFGTNAPGVTTYETWLLDLKSQQWTSLANNVYLTNKLVTLFDSLQDYESPDALGTAFTATPQQIPKSVTGRALFGYVSAPGMGTIVDQSWNSTGTLGEMANSLIDLTDRLMIVGGLGTAGTFTGTHRFNPTFGPEYQNVLGVSSSLLGSGGAVSATNLPVVWIDSYHTQLTNNTYGSMFKPLPTTAPYSPFTSLSSRFTPDLPPMAAGPTGGQSVINSAFVSLVNTNTSGVANDGVKGTGYLLAAGGFDATELKNVPDTTLTDAVGKAACTTDSTAAVAAAGGAYGTNTDLRCGGGLSIQTRYFATGAANPAANENLSSNWSAIPNYLDANTTPNTPALWTQMPESQDGALATERTVPFVGGATMLPGFNLATNDVVYFGGLDCRSYVSDPTSACAVNGNVGNVFGSTVHNPGRYWSFDDDISTKLTAANRAAGFPASNLVPDNLATGGAWPTGSIPVSAGMASARGLDPFGNIIILAWGGAKSAATVEGFNRIYYLTGNVAPGTWRIAAPTASNVSGDVPAELINAQMVFSHVTHKFYVFGGYDPSVQLTRGDTYELTITNTGNASCTTGTCKFVWKKLNSTTGTGLTCYPTTCPAVRRSHRMAEVNYYNRNPGGTVGGVTTGEQPCTASAPCSYGIFMEGGTPDGMTYHSDRWMFDPTANGGKGHWQKMGELPPRALSAMTALDYAIPINGQISHRAVMFGGETGMHNPEWAVSGYFVPPTLGDTWMFDYDSQSWNRVELLGKGYNAGGNPLNLPGGTISSTEFAHREAFDATLTPAGFDAGLPGDLGLAAHELSPPPLAGAIMVTRTQAPPVGATASTSPLRTLKLPEVYLFGGRLKDGSFNPISNTYKFCAGSSGEAYRVDPTLAVAYTIPNTDDYTCDAFDSTLNPASPSPVAGYVGRWLSKKPTGVTTSGAAVVTSTIGAYLGAGAYDAVRDRIVLFGGLTSLSMPATTAVTDTANLAASAKIYEYTPPQPQLGTNGREGRWTYVPACVGYTAPVGRYGHTLAYDTLGQNLILMGGYGADGTPLTTTIQDPSSGITYDSPEVWTGTYCSSANCGGKFEEAHPGLSLGNTPCYFWQPITTFGNSSAIQAQLPPQTGLGHAASVFIPSTGYNSGYYSMFDSACTNSGPIVSADVSLNKLLAGGAYIDIDRSQLGASENLILNITFMPMGPNNRNPDASLLTADEGAVFRIHLVRTGQSREALQAALQPRYMGYSDHGQFPEIVQSLSVMAPPTGQVTQEQVIIPLSIDPDIDRIRIERYSGTGILLDAALYRMGTK
jgi:hypothetical protein